MLSQDIKVSFGRNNKVLVTFLNELRYPLRAHFFLVHEGLLVCQWGRNTGANNKNALYLGCSSHAQALGSLVYSILRVALWGGRYGLL